MVCAEPQHGRVRLALREVVFLVPRYACNGKTFRVCYASLAVTVDYVVDCPRIVPVEYRGVYDVLADEGFFLDFGNDVLPVFHENDYFVHVGTVAYVLPVVFLFQAGAYEPFLFVYIKFCIGGADPRDFYVFEAGYPCAARMVFAVFLFQALVPADCVFCQVFQIVSVLPDFAFDGFYLFVHGLDIELGYFPYRFFHEFFYVLHGDVAAEQVPVFCHFGEGFRELFFPVARILFKYLVHPLFKEYFFQGTVVPFVFKLIQTYLQLSSQKFLGVLSVVAQQLVGIGEKRLVVFYDAHVGAYRGLAVRESVQCIYGLVR